jgi:hypothetical protein
MKTTRSVLFGTGFLAAWAASAPAQLPIKTTVAFFSETYSFDPSPNIGFQRVNEYTVPVGVNVRIGERGEFALSTGYAHVVLRGAPGFTDQRLSGLVDTEARFSWDVLPGRLTMIATGAIPTGIRTVETDELSVLGALASDIIGFTSPNLGSGGRVGLGFAGAVPLGSWAIGLGATVREAFQYTPVTDDPNALTPGREVRLRGGVEGRLGQRTYVRVAAIYALRAKDTKGDETRPGIGHRTVGYLSVSQGIGNTSLLVYGFDVWRGSPLIQGTALGAARLPRGNLLGAGASWFVPVIRRLSATARTEFRNSAQGGLLRLAGRSWRGGVDLRYQITPQFAVVGQAGGVTGFLVPPDVLNERIHFDGLRTAIHAEWRP